MSILCFTTPLFLPFFPSYVYRMKEYEREWRLKKRAALSQASASAERDQGEPAASG